MDPNYEFDAPLFVDFERVRDGTESEDMDIPVDHWFINHSHLEGDLIPPNLAVQARAPQTFSGNFTPAVVKQEPTEEEGGKEEGEELHPATEPGDVEPVNVVSVKRERESCDSSTSTDPDSNPAAPAKLGQKRSATIASLQTPVQKLQKVQRVSSKKAAASIHKILKPRENHTPTTSAKTPEHMKRYLAKKRGQVKKTREELEAEEMEKIQAESKKKLREYRKSFHRLNDSAKKPPRVVKKHSKPTTESVEFRFRTDERLKRQAKKKICTLQPPLHPSNFPMTLRSADREIDLSKAKKATKAKPFKFNVDTLLQCREARKREEEGGGEEKKEGDYVPTAEFVFKFHTGTPPERFRSLPRRSLRSVAGSSADESASGRTTIMAASSSSNMTVPYTPKLATRSRTRPVLAKSTAELEEEEMSKIREKPMKALPLNPKIFTKGGLLGVPAKLQHSVTEPHPPKLATRERETARSNKVDNCERHVSFKAHPVPKTIFERVTGLPEKEQHLPTCPQSPAFALKERNLHRATAEDKEEEKKCQIVIARPVPDFSHKFEPQLTHKRTEAEPFSLEERYKDKPTRATLIQQILEREKKEPFRANPVPDFEGPVLPAVQPQPVTNPKTPTLHTKTRGREYENKWKETLNEMERKAKENAEFRARDAKVLYKAPFTTTKSDQPMTEVSNVLLRTELRSEQRAKFDSELEEREREREAETRERGAQTEAVEARRLAHLRRSLVHKALPVHCYTPTVILPSSKLLTAPHSPNFQIRLRGMH